MFNRIAFMATEFVHLRLHSEFSVVDGVTRIDDVVRRAAADGQGAIALTDSANLFGAIRFYVAARRAGVERSWDAMPGSATMRIASSPIA